MRISRYLMGAALAAALAVTAGCDRLEEAGRLAGEAISRIKPLGEARVQRKDVVFLRLVHELCLELFELFRVLGSYVIGL